MTKNLVEGHFVITVDNLIFEVKGILHPRDRVISYLRYVPDTNEVSGYRKVYALDERETYLQNNYPSYLWFSEYHGRVIQSVPIDRIKLMLNPVDCLKKLRVNNETISDLEKSSVSLTTRLVEITGIDWADIGITGSQLVGVAREDSDIDLVVYGLDICQKFYSNLRDNISSVVGIERYSGSLLDEHVSFRWKAHEDLKPILREIEQAKLLQGLFEGHHFFVRLVKIPGDFGYTYGDFSYQMKGEQLVTGKVVDDNESIFTPCEYLVKCDGLPNLRKLVSYRGRFTEQVSKGEVFEARGRLEMVTDHKKQEQFMQLVLGELPIDYLIPK
ncbi:MAG: hypothetical protein ACFFBL_05295 [Promethearchaeota archaeon]